MKKTAYLSPCRTYRYSLWRRWGDGPFVMFIGLNPSTADETEDDPTIRRCIRFAQNWGFDALCMANLFAFRATDPRVMKQAADPVGRDNDSALLRIAVHAGSVVAAWGTHGSYQHRDVAVRQLLAQITPLHRLRLTKDGHPGHPLYLPNHLTPVLWEKP